MKNTIKQITAGTFIALLLLVGNVKASEIETSNFEATETTLQLESWMMNETLWNPNSLNIIEFAQEMETEMELESWMTNDESWNTNNGLYQEAETEMELEDWMIYDDTWNKDNIAIEPALMVEPWMTNSNIWK